MYKKILVSTLIVAALGACSDKKEQPPTALHCQDDAIVQNLRTNIQEIIKQEARQFANSDSRQFVDADKIIAAGGELQISLENTKQNNDNGTAFCSADLSVSIPAEIMTIAQVNSPLLYGEQSLSQLIQQRINGTSLQYNGANTLNSTLNYTPSKNTAGETVVAYADNSVPTLAQTLSAALRPYGVKSILVINGQAINREEALRQLTTAEATPAPDPEAILNQNAANDFASNLPPSEVLTPPTNTNEVMFSAAELEQARAQQREADSDINSLWQRMDQTVQRELLNEQREWITNKNTSCRQAAAKAETTLQAEYLQTQCDARMTRERVQYLRGYTLP